MKIPKAPASRLSRSWLLRAGFVAAFACPLSQVQANEPADGPLIELAVGGDVGLGNRMNSFIPRYGFAGVLADRVPTIGSADLAIVNLEGVVSEAGVQGVDKGQTAPLFFRGRPEMLRVLEAAGISGVTTANNHAGDYGGEAILDQARYLDEMGIAHPGAGANAAEACDPAYLAAKGLRVAYFSVDTTQHRFAATADSPGTCYVSATDQPAWRATFETRVAIARERAHVVLFFVHWGSNFATAPDRSTRELAREIVGFGVDAVIGGNAHRLQGIEIIDGRPVIYDAGTLLFDFPAPDHAALWTLQLSAAGVERAAVTPLISEPGWTRPANAAESDRIMAELEDRSEELGTRLDGGAVELDPPDRASPTRTPSKIVQAAGAAPPPSVTPPRDCVTPSVPSNAVALDVMIGDLRLLGAVVEPMSLVGPALVWVETYWTIDAPVRAETWIAPRGYPAGGAVDAWGEPHHACDWRWPVDRWSPGEIYVDRYPLRPADSALRLGGLPAFLAGAFSGPLQVRVGIEVDSRLVAESSAVASVNMAPPAPLQVVLALGVLAAAAASVIFASAVRRRRKG